MFSKKIRPSRSGAPRLARAAKQTQLRSDVLRESAIAGVVIVVLAAAVYFLEDWAEGRTRERDTLSNAVAQTTSEIAQLQMKITRADKAMPVFQSVFKNPENPEIPLDRQRATEVLERLKEEYLFAALRISMAPVKDMEDAKFKNAFAGGTAVEMTLGVEALSDEHILNFLSQLRQELGGHLKITSFLLTKMATPSPEMLGAITQLGKAALVKADIKLLWIGMKPRAKDAPAAAPALPPPVDGMSR